MPVVQHFVHDVGICEGLVAMQQIFPCAIECGNNFTTLCVLCLERLNYFIECGQNGRKVFVKIRFMLATVLHWHIPVSFFYPSHLKPLLLFQLTINGA